MYYGSCCELWFSTIILRNELSLVATSVVPAQLLEDERSLRWAASPWTVSDGWRWTYRSHPVHSFSVKPLRSICLEHRWVDSWLKSLPNARTSLPGCTPWYCVIHSAIPPSLTRHGRPTGAFKCFHHTHTFLPMFIFIINVSSPCPSSVSGWCQLSCWRRLFWGTLLKDPWILKWQMQSTSWWTG